MDSQDSSAAAAPPNHHPHPHHHHPQPPPPSVLINPHNHHHHHQQQQQHPLPNSSYQLNNNNNNSVNISNANIMHQQNPRFPFNPMAAAAAAAAAAAKPLDHHFSDVQSSAAAGDGGFGAEPARKKRGRPRKYSPDNSIALGLSPATPGAAQMLSMVAHNDSGGGGGGGTPSSDTPGKRNRGRPPGSGKKQMDALGLPGVGFTPHVITVNTGEDIASKIMAFSQQGPRTVCILSANGAICNVTLRQPAMSGGTVTYEGRFEIISLSGSFQLSESNGNRGRIGGLSVSLAGSDGRVLGGGVAGSLKAATQVQIVVGSFIADGKKSKSSSGPSSTPPSNMLNFGTPTTGVSPSPGASSESAEDNDDSPINRGSGHYANPGQQPIQSMPMYSNMGWPNSVKMMPN